jgi:hypothetical protein
VHCSLVPLAVPPERLQEEASRPAVEGAFPEQVEEAHLEALPEALPEAWLGQSRQPYAPQCDERSHSI